MANTAAGLSRRRALAGLGGLAALSLLPGCREAIEAAADSCPEDPAESGGITWNPDIGRPVFWGVQDLTAATHGTPRDLRVYYPSYDGATANAPFLSTHLPVPLGRTRVGDDLKPPQVDLTQQQQFFAGGHLQGVARFQPAPGCRLDLRWNLDGRTGSRRLGP